MNSSNIVTVHNNARSQHCCDIWALVLITIPVPAEAVAGMEGEKHQQEVMFPQDKHLPVRHLEAQTLHTPTRGGKKQGDSCGHFPEGINERH